LVSYLRHEQPELLEFETVVVDARPGAVLLERTTFYPGGGGQLPDRGFLRWMGGEVAVDRLEERAGQLWHILVVPT
jgi:misacylated tRNA(Ala) deacylase